MDTNSKEKISSEEKFTQEDALAFFSDASAPPDKRRKALSILIGAKFLPKEADHALILAGRENWVNDALYAINDSQKLLGIAESIRLSQVVKRWSLEIKKQITTAFDQPLPALTLLSEADDRLNVARACSQFDSVWLPKYIADSIANEETGEKTRAELISALLNRSTTLSDALFLLGQSFDCVRPNTEEPGDTLAKRLVRTLAVLRSAWMDCELETGPEIGNNLFRLVQSTLANVGRPNDEKVQHDLATESLNTIHDIVRTRLSAVADPEIYRLAEYCRSLCGGSWPKVLEKPLARLIRNVTEALVLLGRQGQCDQALLSQLNVLCNNSHQARSLAKKIANKHTELPENVRDWLEHGRIRILNQASEAAIEAATSNADESIGFALKEGRQARQLRDFVRDNLLSSLDLYEPMMVAPVKEMLDRIQSSVIHIETAAILRSIELFGSPGEEIEMSSKFFTQIGNFPKKKVLIKQPAIVRKRQDGLVGDVISKGTVE